MNHYTSINRHSMFAHTNTLNSFQSANEELQQLQQFQKTQQQQIEQQRQLALQDSIHNCHVTPNQLSRLFSLLMAEFNQLDAADKKAMRGNLARVIKNIKKFRSTKTRADLTKARKSVQALRSRVGKKLSRGTNTQTPNFSQVHPHLTDIIDSATRKSPAQIFKTLMRLTAGG